jgi:hypothetical protein
MTQRFQAEAAVDALDQYIDSLILKSLGEVSMAEHAERRIALIEALMKFANESILGALAASQLRQRATTIARVLKPTPWLSTTEGRRPRVEAISTRRIEPRPPSPGVTRGRARSLASATAAGFFGALGAMAL